MRPGLALAHLQPEVSDPVRQKAQAKAPQCGRIVLDS
jgi:hypothetical protein